MYSTKTVVALIVLLAISGVMSTRMTQEAKQQFCVNNPGANYHDGCNNCACVNNKSGESVCQLLPCPDHLDHVNSHVVYNLNWK